MLPFLSHFISRKIFEICISVQNDTLSIVVYDNTPHHLFRFTSNVMQKKGKKKKEKAVYLVKYHQGLSLSQRSKGHIPVPDSVS